MYFVSKTLWKQDRNQQKNYKFIFAVADLTVNPVANCKLVLFYFCYIDFEGFFVLFGVLPVCTDLAIHVRLWL